MSLRATRVEINKNAFINNLNFFRELINNKKICLAVKANAYGHGLIGISKIAEEFGIDYLAVATVNEGIILRNNNINTPILILSPILDQEISVLFEYKLTPIVSHIESLTIYLRYSEKLRFPFPIHLKIDTGMNRAGFSIDTFELAFERILKEESLIIEGICTHFYNADELTEEGKIHTLKQIKLFQEITTRIKQRLDYNIICHIANTYGTLYYPEAYFDMIRIGLGAYGFPNKNFPLIPIMTLKSQIIQSKKIKKGDIVSYGAIWKASNDTNIALIPVGYGDGINRALSNCGQVKIDNKYFPIIGRICMDMLIVNTGNILFPRETEVLIFGDDPILNAESIAKILNTISYEILTNIRDRVYRIYK